MKTRSLRYQLSISLSALLTALLLLFSLFVFTVARNYLYGELDRHLHRDAEAVQQSLSWDGAADWRMQAIKHAEDDPFDTEPHFEVWSYAGEKLYQSSMPNNAAASAVIDLKFLPPELPAKRTYATVKAAAAVVRVGVEPMQLTGISGSLSSAQSGSYKVLIRVFRSESDVQSRLRALAFALALATLSVVALGAALSALLTRRALKPLATLIAQTEAIGSTPHHIQFAVSPESGGSSEVHVLGVSFSHMLARLDASYAQLDGFAADCAHELRTPLAALRARGEGLLASSTVLKQTVAIAEMMESIDRMTVLINRLLSLARAEANSQTLELSALDLLLAAKQTAEVLLPVFEECGQTVELMGEPVAALADATWLQHIVMDLLHNCTRYAPRNSQVRLRVWQDAAEAVLSVEDQGGGLTPAVCRRTGIELQKADTVSNKPTDATKHPDSTCLGLMIAARLTRLQRGRLTARNLGVGWHAVDIRLPLASNRSI